MPIFEAPFIESEEISGFPVDHVFLRCKKGSGSPMSDSGNLVEGIMQDLWPAKKKRSERFRIIEDGSTDIPSFFA